MAAKKTTTKQAPAKKAPAKKTGNDGTKTSAAQAATKKPAVKKAAKGEKKLSALDAAARVLAETKEPMTSKALIEAMAAQGYWKSPGGKTPHATLYAALLREINTKGQDSRFQKTERGLFARNA
jgi:hypothetical protein